MRTVIQVSVRHSPALTPAQVKGYVDSMLYDGQGFLTNDLRGRFSIAEAETEIDDLHAELRLVDGMKFSKAKAVVPDKPKPRRKPKRK